MDLADVVHAALRPLNIALLLVAYGAFYAFYCAYLYPRYFSPLRGVPGPPLAGWLLGHFPELTFGEPGVKYGPVVRLVGPVGRERIVLLEPQALQRMLVADWIDFPRPKFLRDILGLVAGYGLLTVTGDEHRQMRRAMNPAFSIPSLMAQTDMYFDSTETLVDLIKEQLDRLPDPSKGTVMKMYPWMSKVTLDIICDAAFGYHSNSLRDPHNELATAYEDLIDLQSGLNLARFSALVSIPGMPALLQSALGHRIRNAFLPFRPILGPAATLIDTTHRIRAVSRAILAEKLADAAALGAEDTSTKKDIMSLLVRARRGAKGAHALSDNALVDQVLTFLGAGHETTASGLSWTLFLLATHPAAQAELRAEVAPIFAAHAARPDYRALKDLKVLDSVVMESLRLLPPVPMTLREAARGGWLEGTYVPRGTLFQIPIRAINTWAPTWGPDAEAFRPARWLDGSAPARAGGMLSFLAGPHACIGRTMSISEMKAVLAALVAHFAFAPAREGQVARPTAAVTMSACCVLRAALCGSLWSVAS
ncbi:cytochrome P450 [Gloeopeniophorella convolvens]|nr:cytochrome P450 [Gloeopeniophorella convolvens]